MGIVSKLGWLIIIILLILALLYFFDKPTFCNIFSSVMNTNISSKICGSTSGIGNQKISGTTVKALADEANAINSSSPIPIKQVFVFGAGTTIQNTTNSEFANMYYNFSLQKTSQLGVLYDGFYVPTYEVIQETYYKGNSTSIGDYFPSLIGQKVYLNFIAINNKNVSVPYILKSENIKGNEVIWNLTYDGNINNVTKTLYNNSINCTNGIILLNHSALLSPSPCFQ